VFKFSYFVYFLLNILPAINQLLEALSCLYHIAGALLKKGEEDLLTGNKRKPHVLTLLCHREFSGEMANCQAIEVIDSQRLEA
jgi:hypothetical protein